MKTKTLTTVLVAMTLTATLTAFAFLNRDKDKKIENEPTVTSDILAVAQTDTVSTTDRPETKTEPTKTEDPKPTTDKTAYWNSFTELQEMANGQQTIDFKRAVFLVENAFHNGQLNYQEFTTKIAETGKKLKNMIVQKGLGAYKTAGNWAVFTYMTDSIPQNNFQPYTYDFDDFMGDKNWTSMFVSKLMRTKSGNCHSMPTYYKILCNEIGATAHLAIAPNHLYIKHKDENGQWTNVELTNGGFPRDQWIIKEMAISVEAIKNEVYMTPLTEKQDISMCLFDLATAYEWQYGHDEFELQIIEEGLKYFPKCMPLLMAKSNYYSDIGLKAKEDPNADEAFLKENLRKFKEVSDLIDDLGYKEMPIELYEEWVKSVKAEKQKRGITSNK